MKPVVVRMKVVPPVDVSEVSDPFTRAPNRRLCGFPVAQPSVRSRLVEMSTFIIDDGSLGNLREERDSVRDHVAEDAGIDGCAEIVAVRHENVRNSAVEE